MTDRYDNLAKRMECTPEEIPALIQQHAPWNGRDMCNDSIALITEIGRLRDNATRIMLEAERHRRIADDAIERIESAETERQAVVAWLLRNHYDDTAERIERGEHRREENE
jgi:hypothetical protein